MLNVCCSCAACVAKVSGVLSDMPEVAAHKVCLEDGLAIVQLRRSYETTKQQQEALISKLESAGFPATAAQPSAARVTITAATTSSQSGKGGASAAAATPPPTWAYPQHSLIGAVMAGLLSSSCCLLQLMLNALAVLNVAHVGCAGFNKAR